MADGEAERHESVAEVRAEMAEFRDIELHRRVARGFRNRDNYRLRMLLIGGGLTSPHLK